MSFPIPTTPFWHRMPAAILACTTLLLGNPAAGFAAEAIPAPGTMLPPVANKVITAANVAVEHVGTNIPPSAIGEPVTPFAIPNQFDRIRLITAWVERNEAPGKTLIVTTGGRSLPLCSYPNYPRYKGGHDWTTWRHLLYHRFLPNLWRKR